MKKISIILFIIFLGSFSIAQNFNLTSNEFKVGEVYIVEPKILFDFAKYTIKPESYPKLDSIAAFLLNNDSIVIEIGIHTDSKISDKYSIRLDQRRAESILAYLIKKGVNVNRIIAKGYGENELIISDEEIIKMKTTQEREEAHAINRRTELKIIKINSTNELIIDPTIKNEVEEHISSSELGTKQDKLLIYNNRMLVDLYTDDKLEISLKEQDNKSAIFKSSYYWPSDTLEIDGAFGLFGGTGFSVKIINRKATLYHMLISDDSPSYSYKEKDSLMFRLEVPCTDTKIILSEIPDTNKNQVIYGYVEFKSEDYYISSGFADGQEILPRKKQSACMKIYFKSTKLDF